MLKTFTTVVSSLRDTRDAMRFRFSTLDPGLELSSDVCFFWNSPRFEESVTCAGASDSHVWPWRSPRGDFSSDSSL